jgi:hypothetical protein
MIMDDMTCHVYDYNANAYVTSGCYTLPPHLSPTFSFSFPRVSLSSSWERSKNLKICGCIFLCFWWEWRPKSSYCPLRFLSRSYDFRSIFSHFRSSYDLNFREFGSIPGDDFWGIGLWYVEFDLCKISEQSLLIWVGFHWIFVASLFCLFVALGLSSCGVGHLSLLIGSAGTWGLYSSVTGTGA